MKKKRTQEKKISISSSRWPTDEKISLALLLLFSLFITFKAYKEISAPYISQGEINFREPEKTPYRGWIINEDHKRRQSNDYECGPASLAVALELLGHSYTKEEIGKAMGTSLEGTSMLALYRFLEEKKFQVHGFKGLKVKDLRELRHPSIAHIGQDHFVTIMNQKEEYLFVFDPLWGRVLIREEDFSSVWDGVILAISPPPGEDYPHPKDLEIFKDYIDWEYIDDYPELEENP